MNNYLLGSMKRYRQEQRREKWAFIIDASKVIGDLLLGLFVLFGFIIMFADLILAFDK